MSKTKVMMETTDHSPYGSNFDDFLTEHGLLDECKAAAVKAVCALQIEQALQEKGMSKSAFARMLGTSRSQLDRILDPANDAVTLETLQRAAALLGKRLHVELMDSTEQPTKEVEEAAASLRR